VGVEKGEGIGAEFRQVSGDQAGPLVQAAQHHLPVKKQSNSPTEREEKGGEHSSGHAKKAPDVRGFSD
jgi:hypothetical protein